MPPENSNRIDDIEILSFSRVMIYKWWVFHIYVKMVDGNGVEIAVSFILSLVATGAVGE